VIGVDTNVLVRLVVTDDVAQQAAARARIAGAAAAGEGVFVTVVVVAELTWVLESVYGYGREAVAGVVEALLETAPFQVEDREAVLEAVAAFRGSQAGLSDHLVLSVSRANGALPVLTFDRKLASVPGCGAP